MPIATHPLRSGSGLCRRAVAALVLFVLAGTLPLTGCGSTQSVSGVPEEVTRQIPDGSTVVVVKSVETPSDLYRAVEKRLVSSGYRLDPSSTSGRSLRTRFRQMPGGFALRVSVEVRDLGGVSVVRLSGTYRTTSAMAGRRRTGANFDMGEDRRSRSEQQEAQDVEWSSGVSRDAFGELLRIGNELPHESIAYEQ